MITEQESVPIIEKVFFLMEDAMNRKHCMNVAKLNYFAINYWYLIHKRLLPMTHKSINKEPLSFQIQIVIMQVMPVCEFFDDYFKFDWNTEDMEDMRDFYALKCIKRMNEYTFRLLYVYREAMSHSIRIYYKEAIKYIEFIEKSWRFYEEEAAVIIFQFFVYVLHDIIHIAKADPVEYEMAKKQDDFFMIIISVIKGLIGNFDIKWTNCMESLCVVNTVVDFLLLMDWPINVSILATYFKWIWFFNFFCRYIYIKIFF